MENVYRFVQAIKDLDAASASNIVHIESAKNGLHWEMMIGAMVDQEIRINGLRQQIDTLLNGIAEAVNCAR